MGVREDIAAARDDKARARLRSEASRAAVDSLFTSDGLTVNRGDLEIRFDARPQLIRDRSGEVIGVDAMVRVFRGGRELPVDPHRVCINPPLQIPVAVAGADDVVRDGVILRLDPAAAYLQWLESSIREFPNSRGFRTRGTVTTVYSNTSDGYIQSSDATYSNAREGTGSLLTQSGTLFSGQIFQAATYFCFESFLNFDTSSIADTDVIDSALFDLYLLQDLTIGSDFINECRVYDWGATLTTGDFVAGSSLGSQTLVATFDVSGISAGYNTHTDVDLPANINKAGTTRLMINSDRHRLGLVTSRERIQWRAAETSGTSQDPRLTITHHDPTPDWSAMWQQWPEVSVLPELAPPPPQAFWVEPILVQDTTPFELATMQQWPDRQWYQETNYLTFGHQLLLAAMELIPETEAADTSSPAMFAGEIN